MARGRGRPADLPSLPLQAATLAKPPPSGRALPSLLWLLAKRQRCPPGPGSPMAPGGGRLLLASGCARPARPAPGLELCPLGPCGPETRCFLPSAEPAPGLAVLAGPVEVPPPPTPEEAVAAACCPWSPQHSWEGRATCRGLSCPSVPEPPAPRGRGQRWPLRRLCRPPTPWEIGMRRAFAEVTVPGGPGTGGGERCSRQGPRRAAEGTAGRPGGCGRARRPVRGAVAGDELPGGARRGQKAASSGPREPGGHTKLQATYALRIHTHMHAAHRHTAHAHTCTYMHAASTRATPVCTRVSTSTHVHSMHM